MTEVGGMFAVHISATFIGSMVGGALTDRFGRKFMIIFGLLVSAFTALSMGLINDWRIFYYLAFLTGLFANIGNPAVQAMMADILPEYQRAQGYGIQRVAINLSVSIGPMVGGILAGINYLILFVIDCIISSITALIVFLTISETKPKRKIDEPEESLTGTIRGYVIVFKDKIFIAFLVFGLLTVLVYIQMTTTLSVFLRDIHGIPPQGYGYILSLNAIMVVIFQFWVTRKISNFQPLMLLFVSNLIYAVGFGMYGFVNTFPLFLLAMVIITIAEMINSPITQSMVAHFAPENMRGRYMAVFGLSWGIPSAIGPLAAGWIMDNYNPNWVWYLGGIICIIAGLGYWGLHQRIGTRFKTLNATSQPPDVNQ